ncbi:hypothetical protein EJ04DRAFT_470453 [Polyplosphaeria fusca]|uniref:F-box domain-containing protein n=1 Tax=Polyplosphaeria fusca TaxID=682080 RepID=A0A9P4QR55_9PLEO|nr:hypothetical protein EJ04DRAFT_470453 [Polyplosphaeria fusca]
MLQNGGSSDDEPLEDTTAAIPLHSKRTERKQRKRATRDHKKSSATTLSQLPTELIVEVLKLLRPSDVFSFANVDRRFRALVHVNADNVGDEIIQRRYLILTQCFPLPKLLADIDPAMQQLLTDPARPRRLDIHKRPYQHVIPPNPQLVCTCLTCFLTWNNLGLVLDFAHWQNNLDLGVPIPTLPRGQTLEWNTRLVERSARIVQRALGNSLRYARILEAHLDSTVRAIRRHQGNKGNKRMHVDMTDEEAASGVDSFLQKAGPQSLEFPYNRDDYDLLEAYLPNRWWFKRDQKWVYTIARQQHERDLDLLANAPNR